MKVGKLNSLISVRDDSDNNYTEFTLRVGGPKEALREVANGMIDIPGMQQLSLLSETVCCASIDNTMAASIIDAFSAVIAKANETQLEQKDEVEA